MKREESKVGESPPLAQAISHTNAPGMTPQLSKKIRQAKTLAEKLEIFDTMKSLTESPTTFVYKGSSAVEVTVDGVTKKLQSGDNSCEFHFTPGSKMVIAQATAGSEKEEKSAGSAGLGLCSAWTYIPWAEDCVCVCLPCTPLYNRCIKPGCMEADFAGSGLLCCPCKAVCPYTCGMFEVPMCIFHTKLCCCMKCCKGCCEGDGCCAWKAIGCQCCGCHCTYTWCPSCFPTVGCCVDEIVNPGDSTVDLVPLTGAAQPFVR